MLPRWTRVAFVGAGASLLVACPLDERRLTRLAVTWSFGDGGAAGRAAPTDAAGGADAVGGASAAGARDDAGAAGETPLVTHWSFDATTDGFTAEPGVEQAWSAVGFEPGHSSGSLVVANALLDDDDDFWMAGTWKCVAVIEKRYYDVSAEILIAAGQRPGAAGYAVEFFNAPGCQGMLLDLSTYLTAATGEWVRADRNRSSPPGAKSALLRLVVTKIHRDPRFEARFDRIRFAPE